MKIDEKSLKKLEGVHEDMVKLVLKAAEITTQPFIVTEGLRTLERQKKLLESGASTTLKSRHITGHAVDLAAFVDLDGTGDYTSGDNVRWDWPLYDVIAIAMKDASKELNIPVEWGGDWKSFKDGPHFQLPWKEYPA